VNDLTEGSNGEKLRAALGSCFLEAHSFMVQRRLSVGGPDSGARRRDASWQGAQGGDEHKGSASRRLPDASLFRWVRLPQCLEGALQGTSMIGRWACAEIAVSAGQCSHPFQVSAGISSAQAEQSHHPCLNELSSRRTGWGVVHHEYSNNSRALGTVCSLWTLWSSAQAASLPSNARLHCTTVKHTAGGQRLGRLACFATEKKTRNHILLAYAISSSSVGAETGHAVHFQTCAKQRSCHFTTRFHPPTQRAKRNRRGNFGGPLADGGECAGLMDTRMAC
jgi:hypothetical protein